GHCSTHAPHVVHDHSTSGSMTPSCSAVPTSGRVACRGSSSAIRDEPDSGTPWPLVSTESTASGASLPPIRYGAFANRWSRRSMITSFGDSGLPVFHAGHWLWHRPHSVQVAKSR